MKVYFSNTLLCYSTNSIEHGWRKSEARLEDLRTDNPTRPPSLISEDTKVYIM